MPTPNTDYDDLVKRIKPTASASNTAAATIALRLIEAQLSGSGSLGAASIFDPTSSPNGSDFDRLLASIKSSINAL